MLKCVNPTKRFRKNSRTVPLRAATMEVVTWTAHAAVVDMGVVTAAGATAAVAVLEAAEEEEEAVVAEEEAVGKCLLVKAFKVCVFLMIPKARLTTASCKHQASTANLRSHCTTIKAAEDG